MDGGPDSFECSSADYSDPGATASDYCDAEVAVMTGGDVVDLSAVGSYAVTYDASDAAAEARRQPPDAGAGRGVARSRLR